MSDLIDIYANKLPSIYNFINKHSKSVNQTKFTSIFCIFDIASLKIYDLRAAIFFDNLYLSKWPLIRY